MVNPFGHTGYSINNACMSPGIYPNKVNNRFIKNLDPMPYSKATARGGNNMASIIFNIDDIIVFCLFTIRRKQNHATDIKWLIIVLNCRLLVFYVSMKNIGLKSHCG